MGSVTYDFLTASFLFNDEAIENVYNGYSNREIEEEVNRYTEYVGENIDVLDAEIGAINSDLNVFSTINQQSINFLTQTALYLDQFIIQDPIFSLSTNQTLEAKEIGKFFGHYPLEVDRLALSSTCRYLKKITPMVAANYIKLYPISTFTTRQWTGQLTYDPKNFSEALEEKVRNFFWDKAVVKKSP